MVPLASDLSRTRRRSAKVLTLIVNHVSDPQSARRLCSRNIQPTGSSDLLQLLSISIDIDVPNSGVPGAAQESHNRAGRARSSDLVPSHSRIDKCPTQPLLPHLILQALNCAVTNAAVHSVLATTPGLAVTWQYQRGDAADVRGGRAACNKGVEARHVGVLEVNFMAGFVVVGHVETVRHILGERESCSDGSDGGEKKKYKVLRKL